MPREVANLALTELAAEAVLSKMTADAWRAVAAMMARGAKIIAESSCEGVLMEKGRVEKLGRNVGC